MTRRLYEIGLADHEIRPSPFCWIAKLALLHKGLEFETVPVGFSEKEKYPDPDYSKVPVLVVGDEIVRDSAVILDYLDRIYPEKPLAKSAGERAAAAFFSAWTLGNLFPALGPMIMKPLLAGASAADQAYIKKTFKERAGLSIDAYAALPGGREKTEAALGVLAAPLGVHDFFGGSAPNMSDYIVFGPLMWARVATQADLYEAPAPVARWIGRMLDLFNGYARKAKRLP